jgi:hypothetical protein
MPVSLSSRMRSWTWARWRWRRSIRAISGSVWSVRIAWKRSPSWSVNDSCAPGCGRSRRTISLRPRGPGGQIDPIGDLHNLAVLTLAPIRVQRRHPSIGRDFEDRGPDRLGQFIAEREAHAGLAAVIGQPVGSASGVRAHQDLELLDVLGRDPRERSIEHQLVIGHRVRTGVPRTQQRAQRLPRLIRVRLQGIKPVAPFVVAGCALLLRLTRNVQ